MGSVQAIVVDTVRRAPGQMAGIGACYASPRLGDVTGLLDTVTGGEVTMVEDKLDSISLGLKLSIVGSVLSGALAAVALYGFASRGAVRSNPSRRRRRRGSF